METKVFASVPSIDQYFTRIDDVDGIGCEVAFIVEFIAETP